MGTSYAKLSLYVPDPEFTAVGCLHDDCGHDQDQLVQLHILILMHVCNSFVYSYIC